MSVDPAMWQQQKHYPTLVPIVGWELLHEEEWLPVVAIAVDGDGALIALGAPKDAPVVVVRNLQMRQSE